MYLPHTPQLKFYNSLYLYPDFVELGKKLKRNSVALRIFLRSSEDATEQKCFYDKYVYYSITNKIVVEHMVIVI
jgi:hypothetical protein